MRAAMSRRTGVIGMICPALGFVEAARTSDSRMRPARPLPFRCFQSTPSSRATRLARGLMAGSTSSDRAGGVSPPERGLGGLTPPARNLSGLLFPRRRFAGSQQIAEQRPNPKRVAGPRGVRRKPQDAAVQRLHRLNGLVALQFKERLPRTNCLAFFLQP